MFMRAIKCALTIVKSPKNKYKILFTSKKSETVHNESDKDRKFRYCCYCYQRGQSGSIANKKQEVNNNNNNK